MSEEKRLKLCGHFGHGFDITSPGSKGLCVFSEPQRSFQVKDGGGGGGRVDIASTSVEGLRSFGRAHGVRN